MGLRAQSPCERSTLHVCESIVPDAVVTASFCIWVMQAYWRTTVVVQIEVRVPPGRMEAQLCPFHEASCISVSPTGALFLVAIIWLVHVTSMAAHVPRKPKRVRLLFFVVSVRIVVAGLRIGRMHKWIGWRARSYIGAVVTAPLREGGRSSYIRMDEA